MNPMLNTDKQRRMLSKETPSHVVVFCRSDQILIPAVPNDYLSVFRQPMHVTSGGSSYIYRSAQVSGSSWSGEPLKPAGG